MQSHSPFRSIVAYVVVTTVAVCATFVLALQSQLPDGPGKPETVRVCSGCHQVERATAVRLTREGWENLIGEMVQRGAKATDDDRKAILDYLATNFLGEAAKPLNINRATQLDLEIVAGLLRKESAALLAHLKKNGPCKSLESLKKVAGVEYKKLEERKDYLVCQPLIILPVK